MKINVENKEIVTIGEHRYYIDSLTERGKNIIGDIQRIEQLLSQKQFEISIFNFTINKLVEELEKEKQNFTEVQE